MSLQSLAPELLGLLLEQVPCILWVTDENLRFTALFGAARPVLDVVPERVIRRSLREFVEPEVVDAHLEAMQGTPVTYETTYRGRTFHAHVAPLRDASGGVIGCLGVAHDITESARAQRALERDALLLSNVSDAMVVMDTAGTVTFVNDGASKLFGWKASEVVGAPYTAWVPEPLRAWMTDYVHTRDRSGEWRATFEIVHPEGRRVWIETRLRELRDASGTVIGSVGHSQDITERRRLELQFRQAQKMDAVGRLAGGVAHDFNNLLTVITGYASTLLDRGGHDAETTEMLEHIHLAGDRAAALTRQLLAYSRKQLLHPKVLSLNSVVTDAQRMLDRLIGEDIELLVELDRTEPAVKADPTQLSQVLLNLSVNSRHAMPMGGTLRIATATVQFAKPHDAGRFDVAAGRYATLTVTDTGSGMTDETLRHLFEPFFTTKAPGEGTGLGLATVYGIVKQSEGYIDVQSAPGEGSTFTILLPLVEGPVERESSSAHPALIGTETILLVEDDEPVRLLAQFALERVGYTVIVAESGCDALALAARRLQPVDLLIADVVMPGMSGRQLADALRARQPGTPVLFITGYADDAALRHGVDQATSAVLMKPFGYQELTRKVREVLDAKLP